MGNENSTGNHADRHADGTPRHKPGLIPYYAVTFITKFYDKISLRHPKYLKGTIREKNQLFKIVKERAKTAKLEKLSPRFKWSFSHLQEIDFRNLQVLKLVRNLDCDELNHQNLIVPRKYLRNMKGLTQCRIIAEAFTPVGNLCCFPNLK